MQVILFFLPKKKAALEHETFFIMTTLQPNIRPIKGEGSLFFLHECSYFTLQTDTKNSRPEYISLGKHQQSSRLFLLDPYAWKQWVEGHFISRKRARLSVHIVSMMAIYFARVAGQVCIIEWRLIDKNNRKRYFSILNVVERCTGCAAWLHWILIFLGVGWGDMQCSAVKPSFPAFFFLPFPCFFLFSTNLLPHSSSDDFVVTLQLGAFHAKHLSEPEQQNCIS